MLEHMIILRLLHITTGVFWTGTAVFMAAYILPAANALGPEGGKFMQQLSGTRHLSKVIALVASVNILAGLSLLWILSDGFQLDWLTTRHGIILSLGGLSTLIAFTIGFTVNRPSIDRMMHLGNEIKQAGGPPSPSQMQEIIAIRKKLTTASNIVAWLLSLTVIAMSVIRYL